MICIVTASDFRHTSNNISSGISIKLFRAARLPRVFLEDEPSTKLMLCASIRPRFEGLLSACCASGMSGVSLRWSLIQLGEEAAASNSKIKLVDGQMDDSDC
jgi:hypothetical protein